MCRRSTCLACEAGLDLLSLKGSAGNRLLQGAMESRRLPKLYIRHFSSSPDSFGAGSDQDRDTAMVSVVSSCPSRCLPRARLLVGPLVQLALITASSRRMPASGARIIGRKMVGPVRAAASPEDRAEAA